MLDIVICELLKLKRSKIVGFSLVGSLAVPILMLVEALQTHLEHPEQVFTFAEVYENSLLYVMLLMNMMIYVAITAYLFSREYGEKTLKTVLPIPVSRVDFITGKFLVLFLWTMILSMSSWFAILILMYGYHLMIGLNGFSIVIAFEWLVKFVFADFLMFATSTPFAYLSEKSKGFVLPIITSSAIVMGSAAISNQKIGVLYPWVGTWKIVIGDLQNSAFPAPLIVGIIIFVSFFGLYLTYSYFLKEDIA